ncbi:hypothetical protein GCM10009678_87990 [Actinomadura kijaniata]
MSGDVGVAVRAVAATRLPFTGSGPLGSATPIVPAVTAATAVAATASVLCSAKGSPSIPTARASRRLAGDMSGPGRSFQRGTPRPTRVGTGRPAERDQDLGVGDGAPGVEAGGRPSPVACSVGRGPTKSST